MDKYLKVIDITEHPENYSENELMEILKDPEVREMYNLMCDADSALRQPAKFSGKDVEDEWRRFKQSKKRKAMFPKFLTGRVAATVCVVVTSAVALAIGVGIAIKNSGDKVTQPLAIEIPSKSIQSQVVSKDNVTQILTDSIEQKTVVFENEPLSMILDQISQYYGLKLEIVNKQASTNRFFFKWNKTESAEEIVRQLNNFEIIKLTLSDKTLILK